MNVVEICVAFLAAIVSVGTPLIFDVISKVDEKYHSEVISNLLNKTSKKKTFQVLLVIATIIAAIYIGISIFLLYPNTEYKSILIKVASFALILSTALVVGFFIHFTFISIKFSRPSSLFLIIKEKNKKEKFQKDETMDSFFDFSIYSIRTKDFNTFYEKTIKHFIDISNEFKESRTSLLPNSFFQFGYRVTKELTSNKDLDYNQFKYLTTNYLWIINKLDETEYLWLWRNLRISIENHEDEMVIYYWKRAFQYFEYDLRMPDSIYSTPFSGEKENQAEISQKEKERRDFLDFHYYLGGLLLFEDRINCIRRIWDHTNSEPPRYPLLPSTLGEIFTRYFKLSQIFDPDLRDKALRYGFPKVDSINSDWIVNSWIRKYLVILFLRQYTLRRYYTFENFLELPISPKTQAEKKHWIDNIQRFIDQLKEVLANSKLLEALRFDHITEAWCKAEKKIYPSELVNEFKRQLEEDFGQTIINQPVSPEKERKFWTSSKKIIEEAIVEYDAIINKTTNVEDINYRKPFYINGNYQLAHKSDFAGDQPYDHWYYDSFLAEQVANKMRWAISETFLMVTTQGYLLKEYDLFKAIDQLKITENAKDFVIISFKNNIEYYIRMPHVQGLNKSVYNGVEIIDIWNCSGHIVGNTFFILKKSDLPWLEFKEPALRWEINWKEEEMIIPDKHISASIIDLHKHPEVSQILKEEGNKENLDDKVLVNIEMLALIHWKENAKVIALETASAYEDRGIPNKLEEVKPFDEI
jgi:hypothetical protein